jgi:hypothetical protein
MGDSYECNYWRGVWRLYDGRRNKSNVPSLFSSPTGALLSKFSSRRSSMQIFGLCQVILFEKWPRSCRFVNLTEMSGNGLQKVSNNRRALQIFCRCQGMPFKKLPTKYHVYFPGAKSPRNRASVATPYSSHRNVSVATILPRQKRGYCLDWHYLDSDHGDLDSQCDVICFLIVRTSATPQTSRQLLSP